MQKTFKFAVTVGRSENVALEKLAQTWAVKFGVKYVERGSRGSLGFLLDQERVEALLVATNKGIYCFWNFLFSSKYGRFAGTAFKKARVRSL
jgi:hypothetical protein